MYKPKTKKMLTVAVTLAMVFSAFAILSFAATPAYAATSGTVTASSTTLYVNVNNTVLLNGGSFSQGAPLYYEFLQSNGWVPHSYDWLALTPPNTTLVNAPLVLTPTSTGTWYLLISDTHDGSNGVLSVQMSVVGDTGAPSFQVDPAYGSETALVPGWTSNAPQSATIYGANVSATDSITFYMLKTNNSATNPYYFPDGLYKRADVSGSVISTQTFTGAQLLNGASFVLPYVAGGSYAFIGVDTTTGMSMRAVNGLVETSSDFYGLTAAHYTAYPSAPNYFFPGNFTYGQLTDIGNSSLQLFIITPSIVYSVSSLSGLSSQNFSFTGYGFIPGSTFSSGIATVTLAYDVSGSPSTPSVPLQFISPAVVGSNGEVSFTGVHLSATTTTGGLYDMLMTDDSGLIYSVGSYPQSETYTLNGIYISTPSINQGELYFFDLNTGSTTEGYVGDSALVIVYNFPADTSVNIMMGPDNLGPVTTDVNGFATNILTIPALPGSFFGVYYNIYANTTNGATGYTASLYTNGNDGGFFLHATWYSSIIQGEYVPSGGVIDVQATGLYPNAPYTFYVEAGINMSSVSVTVGSLAGVDPYYVYLTPAANGSLSFTVALGYGFSSDNSTSNYMYLEDPYGYDLTMNNGLGNDYLYTYEVAYIYSNYFPDYIDQGILQATPGGSVQLLADGSQSTNSIFNLIPSTAVALYSNVSNVYALFVGTSQVTFNTNHNYFYDSSPTLSFTAPSTDGVYTVYVDYYGTSPSNAAADALDSFLFVVSTPNSGNTGLVMGPSSNVNAAASEYTYFVAYNLPTSSDAGIMAAWTGGYFTANDTFYPASSGVGTYVSSLGVSVLYESSSFWSTGTYVAYAVADLNGYPTSPLASVSFTVSSAMYAYDYNAGEGYGYGFSGDWAVVHANGLLADTTYNVYFNGMLMTTWTTYSHGNLGSEEYGPYFQIPLVAPGMYEITITPVYSSTVVESTSFLVEQPLAITLYPGGDIPGGMSGNYAFPGEVVSYSWFLPDWAQSGVFGNYFGYFLESTFLMSQDIYSYQVMVELNNTTYYTVNNPIPRMTEMGIWFNGSFVMPNAPQGTYWGVTFNLSVTFNNSDYNVFGPGWYIGPTNPARVWWNSAFYWEEGSGGGVSYLGLAEGNGALLTGISADQMATLSAAVGNQITTSMAVPLSELHGIVTQLNSTSAQITTAFGNMTSTLSAINATASAIQNGQVVVQTDLGSIQTSLTSVGASLTAVNGNVATVGTAVGNVQTTLSTLGATINTTATNVNNLVGNTATIKTDLGTFTGTITSVSGGLATIQTKMGNLTASVSSIQTSANKITTSQSTLEIFLIVIIVLVLITLVAAFLAVSAANKAARRAAEQKKE